jgi:hypothetical protein
MESAKKQKAMERYEQARHEIDLAEMGNKPMLCITAKDKGYTVTGAECGLEEYTSILTILYKNRPEAFILLMTTILMEGVEHV